MTQIDPTQFSLHNGLLESIDFNPATHTLTMLIELNLGIEVAYTDVAFDPENPVDDVRSTRLIFHGVSQADNLPIVNDGRDDPETLYGAILEFQWHSTSPLSTTLLVEVKDFSKKDRTWEVVESTITYQSVEWQIDDPAPAEAKPFKPTQINEAAWAQFEQALDAERQVGRDVQVDIQVINLPNADRRPIILGAAYTVDGAPFYHAFHYHNDAVYDLSEASLKELYQALRNTIHGAVQGPWETARVVAEIHEDDHGLLYGRFASPQARQEQGFKVDYQLFFVLRELRSRAATPWVQAQFTLTNDGWLTIHATHADTTTSSEQHHV